jgi:hypothetical protein
MALRVRTFGRLSLFQLSGDEPAGRRNFKLTHQPLQRRRKHRQAIASINHHFIRSFYIYNQSTI